MKKIEKLMKGKNNFIRYKTKINEFFFQEKPSIPFMSIMLRDLIVSYEVNPNFEDDLINYEKLVLYAQQINKILSYQTYQYEIAKDFELYNRLKPLTFCDEERLYKTSLYFRPSKIVDEELTSDDSFSINPNSLSPTRAVKKDRRKRLSLQPFQLVFKNSPTSKTGTPLATRKDSSENVQENNNISTPEKAQTPDIKPSDIKSPEKSLRKSLVKEKKDENFFQVTYTLPNSSAHHIKVEKTVTFSNFTKMLMKKRAYPPFFFQNSSGILIKLEEINFAEFFLSSSKSIFCSDSPPHFSTSITFDFQFGSEKKKEEQQKKMLLMEHSLSQKLEKTVENFSISDERSSMSEEKSPKTPKSGDVSPKTPKTPKSPQTPRSPKFQIIDPPKSPKSPKFKAVDLPKSPRSPKFQIIDLPKSPKSPKFKAMDSPKTPNSEKNPKKFLSFRVNKSNISKMRLEDYMVKDS